MPPTIPRAALFFSALLAFAGSSGTHAQELRLEEILMRYEQAIGGKAAWQEVSTLKQVATASSAGADASLTISRQRPNKQRIDFQLQGMSGWQVFDGERAWIVTPFMGNDDPQPLPPETEARLRASTFSGALLEAAEAGHEVSLVGRLDESGRALLHLHLELADGGTEEVYLDAESFLPLRVETKNTVREQTVVTTTTFGDYRPVGKLVLPHTIETRSDTSSQTLRITEVEVNPPLDEALFRAKESAAAMTQSGQPPDEP